MSDQRFNSRPDLAEMAMRGEFTFAYEAALAARIIRILKDRDQHPQKAQRAVILTLAEEILKQFATTQVKLALDARDWLAILSENTDGQREWYSGSADTAERSDGASPVPQEPNPTTTS